MGCTRFKLLLFLVSNASRPLIQWSRASSPGARPMEPQISGNSRVAWVKFVTAAVPRRELKWNEGQGLVRVVVGSPVFYNFARGSNEVAILCPRGTLRVVSMNGHGVVLDEGRSSGELVTEELHVTAWTTDELNRIGVADEPPSM
jgi:hypothetical protein